jgi:DNA-directed RNA polymerase specialized sigma24 family protein
MHEHVLTEDAGYDLFRRAIVERDEEAWAAIYTHFRQLLISWARHASARAPAVGHYEDIADRALARAWAALTAEQFGQFPSLASLLAYLRTCVGAAAIDAARAEATRERAYQKLDLPSVTTPEELVLSSLSRAELWRLLNKLISTELERIILIESFVLGLPPRAILERHQDRFADVPAIYGAKRNLLNRLERSHDLQRIYQDLRAA